MHDNIPTYLPGDTIGLKLEIQHEANLVDVWANFEKQEEVRTLRHFQFTAKLRDLDDLRQLNWVGAQRTSEVLLKAPVSKEYPLLGDYQLVEIRGLPFGEERDESNVLVFEAPADVRLRIAAPPSHSVPTVTQWELEDPTPQNLSE